MASGRGRRGEGGEVGGEVDALAEDAAEGVVVVVDLGLEDLAGG
jgi:hypothetical protein